ncbi:MAG: twin-arginine translocase subunit TatC [Thermodesulfobacteriota bacterium]|nr:twin-arginine translocase subunit TatC [Thermodesulfobacteriota bacterium]
MEEEKLPITDHLEELRSRIIKCLIAVGAGFLGTYAFSEKIFSFLVAPLVKVMPEGSNLIYTSLPEAFFTYLKVSFFAGLVLSLPVILYQLWKFVLPGLHRNESRYVLPFVLMATIFFLVGAGFAFFIVFPLGFKFFLGFSTDNISALPSLKEYLSLSLRLLLAFGITFELPVVMYFLAKMGIVNYQMLAQQRKYAIMIVVVVAAVLTPPDIISQVLLAIPLIGLYELSIWVTRFVNRGKDEDQAVDEPDES